MKSVNMMAGIKQICAYYKLDETEFYGHMLEDQIGGYHEDEEQAKWPCGSIWEVEGRVLYALVRMLKPKNVVEIGTFHGCSATHIASALVANGAGKLYAVDPAYNGGQIPEPYLDRIQKRAMTHKEFAETTRLQSIDMLFEDGAHAEQTTFEAIDMLMPIMSEGAAVVVHDACHFLVGKDVSAGIQRAVGDFESVLIEPSDCGLGYWKKA